MSKLPVILLIVVAVIAIAAGLLWYGSLRENQSLKAEISALQSRIEAVPTATGGAEIPMPAPEYQADWMFPIAAGDFLAYTSPFGYRVSPLVGVEMNHLGVDIAGVWRSRVVAVADGEVVEHWPPPDGYWKGHDVYGGMIEIRHQSGEVSRYAHLSATRVHTGDLVRAGAVIGRTGNTGKSDGEHLHFEVISNTGEYLNPLLYVRSPG